MVQRINNCLVVSIMLTLSRMPCLISSLSSSIFLCFSFLLSSASRRASAISGSSPSSLTSPFSSSPLSSLSPPPKAPTGWQWVSVSNAHFKNQDYKYYTGKTVLPVATDSHEFIILTNIPLLKYVVACCCLSPLIFLEAGQIKLIGLLMKNESLANKASDQSLAKSI